MEEKEKKVLTELQTKFLAALFGEGEGDPRTSARLAGYSDATSLKEILEPLKEEIAELSKSFLSAHAPKAVIKLVTALDEKAPNGNHLKVIDMVLNRSGMSEKEGSGDVNLKVPSGGLFILPAKEVKPDDA